MKCPHCLHENIEGVNFCTKCGKKMEDESNIICNKCGQSNVKESSFCISCGEKIKVEEDNSESGFKYCSSCGASNPKDNLYCIGCGAKLYQNVNQSVNSGLTGDIVVDNKAKVSLILGIVGASISFVCCCVPFVAQIVGLVLGIIGLIMGIKGLKSIEKNKAIIGLVLSIISICISGLMLISYSYIYPQIAGMTEEELEEWLNNYYQNATYIFNRIKIMFNK